MALNRREKALLSLPVLLGGVMSFYNWVHEPLFTRRAEAQQRFDQVRTELTRDQAKLAREGDLSARKSAIAAREQTVDSWVPGKNSAALFIWYLSQAELYSGSRIRGITVGDRRQVAAAAAQDGKTGGGAKSGPGGKTESGAKADTNGKAGPAGKTETAANAASPPAEEPTLTVIRLDLKVEARFAEHLLFNQSMEQMPLFLSTDALSLVRGDKLPMERVGKLVAEGNSYVAEQILSASPPVNGTYQIDLYFKSGKAGPATGPMQFNEAAGRMDPFVMDGVEEFIQSLLDYYADPKGFDNSDLGAGRSYRGERGLRSGQLG